MSLRTKKITAKDGTEARVIIVTDNNMDEVALWTKSDIVVSHRKNQLDKRIAIYIPKVGKRVARVGDGVVKYGAGQFGVVKKENLTEYAIK